MVLTLSFLISAFQQTACCRNVLNKSCELAKSRVNKYIDVGRNFEISMIADFFLFPHNISSSSATSNPVFSFIYLFIYFLLHDPVDVLCVSLTECHEAWAAATCVHMLIEAGMSRSCNFNDFKRT